MSTIIQNNNTPTNVVQYRSPFAQMSSEEGELKRKCKYCGEGECTFIAVMDTEAEELKLDRDKFLWLCEKHYKELSKSKEFNLRELPEPDKFKRNKRYEIEDDIVLLQPDNEKEWIQIPEDIEVNLKEER